MVGRQALTNPYTGKMFYVPVKPKTIAQRIVEIRKGLNKENLQPEQRTHTSKKGTQYQQIHWVKKPKEQIPTIELEPLTDISKEEIQELTQSKDKQTIDRLKSVLKERFKENNFITNNSTGNKILITTKGIDKSIIPYTGRHASQATKQSLFYLDTLLENAESKGKEKNIHSESSNAKKANIQNVETYSCRYKLDNKEYLSTIKIRIFAPTKKINYTKHNFYFATVDEIKTEPYGA